MTTRRLVRSGKTSFTLALPIDWVRKHNLDAGDEVEVEENPDGSIAVQPPVESSFPVDKQATRVIEIDGLSEAEVRNELLIAYVQGNALLSLEGKEVSSRANRLVDIIQEFIGFSVIEQGPDFITVKDFFVLDKDTSPTSALRKMSFINRSVFDSLKESLSSGLSKPTLYEVEQLVRQNNRLSTVVFKGCFAVLLAPSQMRAHQLDSISLMKMPQYANGLARMSTQLHEAAEALYVLDYEGGESSLVKTLFNQVHSAHQDVLVALANSDNDGLRAFLARADGLERSLSDAAGKLSDALHARLLGLLWAVFVSLRELSFIAVF